MHVVAMLLLLTVAQGPQAPILEFPEAGVDDPAAYAGYATRFFRDARGNAFQVYVDETAGRVVHVWADAANESAAFTARDTAGAPIPLTWGAPGATTAMQGSERSVRHRLATGADAVDLGWFLLGTMRQERDFQYWQWHRRPFGDSVFVLRELADLVSTVERLPQNLRARHLALVAARDIDELRDRLQPRITVIRTGSAWVVHVEHTDLDGRNHLRLEFRGTADSADVRVVGDRVLVRSRSAANVVLDVTVVTDAAALTPLGRDRLFNPAFEGYYARERRTADSLRAVLGEAAVRDPRVRAFRRFDRQVRGLELLSYEEKLLASMPNYATYFGRDMMMSALMLEPIVSVDVQEDVIASMLRKLAPDGQVSHEEALGGQAIREHAAEYAGLMRQRAAATDARTAAALLDRAEALLADLRRVGENYRMVDDDFQLPVLAARYLTRSDVSADRKRRFLLADAGSGGSRLDALVRNLGFVTTLARPYAERPAAASLVGFYHRDADGWLPGSWRDSRVGYGNGRFAMDVNAVWVPAALEAVQGIRRAVEAAGLPFGAAVARVADAAPALAAYVADSAALLEAGATWRGAWRHFEVRLDPREVEHELQRLLESLPADERAFWRRRLDGGDATARSLTFLAVALDDAGAPIPVANTDPATAVFLRPLTAEVLAGDRDPTSVRTLLDVVGRPYPVGLLVEGLGPLVANDAYASAAVQERFRNDLYHSPRVVWGREVNLLLLGLARQIGAAYAPDGTLRRDTEAVRTHVAYLRDLLDRTRAAVEASGLRHNELWSYRIDGDVLRPVRYGTSSDIQLWNVTDLAVRFLLDRLPSP